MLEKRCSSPIPHHTRGRKKTTLTNVLMNYDMDVSMMIGEAVARRLGWARAGIFNEQMALELIQALQRHQPLWAGVVMDIQHIGNCLRGGEREELAERSGIPQVSRDENTGNCSWVRTALPLTSAEEVEYYGRRTKTIRVIEFLKSDMLDITEEYSERGECLWVGGDPHSLYADFNLHCDWEDPPEGRTVEAGGLKNPSNFREDAWGDTHHWRCHDDFLAVM